ncbi:MAG TPA: hypothetical protein VES42_19465, partial [Pilimelia sp.]|nr:hypothetical protein [Pilimelia sp.]
MSRVAVAVARAEPVGRPAPPARPPVAPVRIAALAAAAGTAVLLLAAVHLTQGTSDVGAADLLGLL